MATIKDVCRIAGVSKATVSRVLNGSATVKKSTKEHVEAVMQQLNYKPCSIAQALANNTSNSFGLILPNFHGEYFGNLLMQASCSAEALGKQLLIADGKNDANSELAAINSLVEKKCDVIVLYSRYLSTKQLSSLNEDIDIPIVHVGRALPKSAGFSIAFNQKKAIEDIVRHLTDLGHKSFLYLGPKPITNTPKIRLNTFKNIINKQYQDLNSTVHHCGFDLVSSYQKALEILTPNREFTAIVAANDNIAISLIRACREKGIKVPEELSIASIDNDKMSEFVTPKLTTVEIPILAITKKAISIAKNISETKSSPSPIIIDGTLLIRETTSVPTR